MQATITNPDGIFTFGVVVGSVITWSVLTIASKLRRWDARNNK